MENVGSTSPVGSKFILGVTGGMGSGEGRVLKTPKEEYDFHVTQADQMVKELTRPRWESYQAVVGCPGPPILNEDRIINRPAMAQAIFGCPDKRPQMDHLAHSLVWDTAFGEVFACPGPLVVIEAVISSKELRDNCRGM